MALSMVLAVAGAAHPHDEEAASIAELIGLQPGMSVADVGAGDGQWGESIARLLDGSGHVFLTEIDEGELIKLRQRVESSALENISVVVGSADEAGLPDSCCDAILLRLVYHHMTDSEAMRASLKRSLRERGLLLIVEMDEGSHGIKARRVVNEMTGDGFEIVSRHPGWGGHDDHYALLFRR